MEQTERSLRHLMLVTKPESGAFPAARDQVSKMEHACNFLTVLPMMKNLMIKWFGGELQTDGQKFRGF